jgi:AcrR family transcriptional regulator
VARTPDPVLKRTLLDQVVRYLAGHGVGHLSLRPMAQALEMSPHRLMHHFGPKDEMVAAAIARATELQEEVQTRWFAEEPAMTQPQLLRRWWYWLLDDPANLALVRLGLEAATLDATVTSLPMEIRAEQIGVWRTEIEGRFVAAGVPRTIAATEASIAKATFTGLVVDLMASGDKERLTQALEEYLPVLEQRIASLADAKSR